MRIRMRIREDQGVSGTPQPAWMGWMGYPHPSEQVLCLPVTPSSASPVCIHTCSPGSCHCHCYSQHHCHSLFEKEGETATSQLAMTRVLTTSNGHCWLAASLLSAFHHPSRAFEARHISILLQPCISAFSLSFNHTSPLFHSPFSTPHRIPLAVICQTRHLPPGPSRHAALLFSIHIHIHRQDTDWSQT